MSYLKEYRDLKPIDEVGDSKSGNLNVPYADIVAKVFKPNATHLDDDSKVLASWGITDSQGRKAFIWSYKYYGDINYCDSFSFDGSKELLQDIFGFGVLD